MRHLSPLWRSLVALGLLICTLTPAVARDFVDPLYPESDTLRSALFDSWLAQELSQVILRKKTVMQDSWGVSFEISQHKDETANLLEIHIRPESEASPRGTWILSRQLSDGMPRSIRIYPTLDSSVYITLVSDGDSPEKGRTLLSVHAYGRQLYQDVSLGKPLVTLYTASFKDIRSLTSHTVRWNLLSPDVAAYEDIRATVALVRSGLPRLVYLDDGAIDERGVPVYIRTGEKQDRDAILAAVQPGQDPSMIIGGVNCSGFAKWVVDGIIRPATGGRIRIPSLKQRTDSPETHFTEPWRESRDLFFGLDWARHLASAAASLSLRTTVLPDSSGVDVTVEPFSGTSGYERNVGYRMSDLLPLMYYLALTEPGHFYLAALSRYRGEPLLRQYHHLAVCMPYFDVDGRFYLVVFENAEETASDSFIISNADAWVHLSRVRAPQSGRFQP